MSDPRRPADSDDPRTYLAAERTLLAWIRTGLALMGFGFIVARFGLFLRELAAIHPETPQRGTGFSLVIGVALVLLGVTTTGLAAWRHYHWISRLREGIVTLPKAASLVTALAAALAIVGLVIAAFLMFGL